MTVTSYNTDCKWCGRDDGVFLPCLNGCDDHKKEKKHQLLNDLQNKLAAQGVPTQRSGYEGLLLTPDSAAQLIAKLSFKS